ncbi:hypothetical protein GLOIN_2v1877063 [Rhizophagus clarus]|uniref:Uncharacterized protein n=1 Tax=Rhizophagus clarus TaxID=94130 RepID=A0A8H3M2D2_9GLOM|nr:hypothetical protein GLOIN_2v1877063 [Rhizophagus clarus]
MEPSSELLYKKLEEGPIFLDMYSDMGSLLRNHYIKYWKKTTLSRVCAWTIDRTCLQNNGKREYHYILNRSKIIAKLRESGLGDMEEFSDIPQPNLPTNEATDIPIFNVPEIIPPKIIPPQPEENLPKRDKKAEPPIASTSGTSSELQSDSGDSEVLVLSDVPDVKAIGGSAPTLPYFFASSSSWHTRSEKLSLFFGY